MMKVDFIKKYSKEISEKFPTFEKFSETVEQLLQSRKEMLVDRQEVSQIRGEAGVLFALCYDTRSCSSILEEVFVLLQRRSKHLSNNPGDMAFPGGSFEDSDQNLTQTAYRESMEELGISSNYLDFIAYMDEFLSTSSYIVRVVVCWLKVNEKYATKLQDYLQSKFSPKTEESDVTIAIPLKYFLNPENYSSKLYNYKMDTGIIKRGYIRYFNIDEYLPNTEIWGLTATIISKIFESYIS